MAQEKQRLARYDNMILELVKEDEGFIFRDIKDKKYGASGHHETAEDAIDDAKRVGCKIYKEI